tara:strand:- start:125 stop:310 length:186 start_codon:yes stop_codon:yes gene_type:complete
METIDRAIFVLTQVAEAKKDGHKSVAFPMIYFDSYLVSGMACRFDYKRDSWFINGLKVRGI